MKVQAITEDENEINLRDANSSRERPRLEGFDLDEDDYKTIDVQAVCIFISMNIGRKRRVCIQCRCEQVDGYNY